MPIRTNGGVFSAQMLTGSLHHYLVSGADFSGAMDSFGHPVPFSAAEIIFNRIEGSAYINIMNPNEENLSFALEADRSSWDATSLTAMIQSLGNDVGIDHVNCSVCVVTQVPYVWGSGSNASSFLELSDTPATYAGAAGYSVYVDNTESGLIFGPTAPVNSFSSIAVASQPTINASGSSTLTFIAGTNIVLSTDPALKTIRIDSTGGGSGSIDYIPISAGSGTAIGLKYFVTSSGIVTLPNTTGAGFTLGQSVTISKLISATVFVNVGSVTDSINTNLGATDSIEMDAADQCIFIYGGSATWNLQVG